MTSLVTERLWIPISHGFKSNIRFFFWIWNLSIFTVFFFQNEDHEVILRIHFNSPFIYLENYVKIKMHFFYIYLYIFVYIFEITNLSDIKDSNEICDLLKPKNNIFPLDITYTVRMFTRIILNIIFLILYIPFAFLFVNFKMILKCIFIHSKIKPCKMKFCLLWWKSLSDNNIFQTNL